MEVKDLYSRFRQFPAVSTDTRSIIKDSLFFALRGDQFNGNRYAADALDKGAKYVIMDDEEFHINHDNRFILVPDTLEALQQLSAFHRQQLNIPVIGLTGSNGKTTTKELIKAVLATRYRVLATAGNLNNHIGVPLTLLSITDDVEIAIIEMGANHIGEIDQLCRLAAPTHGLITNIGKAHLEGFGSLEGVKQAKSELYAYLAATNGQLFLKADNPILLDCAERFFSSEYLNKEAVTYGTSLLSKISGTAIAANPFLIFQWAEYILSTHMAGAYNLENALAAIAVGSHFGLTDEQIKQGIESYEPANNRSQVVDTPRGNRVIGDYYNANASSMAVALENFQEITDGRIKVLILGDMFELGASAAEEHLEVIRLGLETKASKIILIGQHFYELKNVIETDQVFFAPSMDEAKRHLISNPITDSLVLLKGSRGIALEQLVDYL